MNERREGGLVIRGAKTQPPVSVNILEHADRDGSSSWHASWYCMAEGSAEGRKEYVRAIRQLDCVESP
jgi:hypothetical protein